MPESSSPETSKSHKFRIRDHLRYHFDTSIARGPAAFIAWLAAIGIAISVVATLLKLVLNTMPGTPASGVVTTGWFASINNIFFAGNVPTTGYAGRFVYFVTWLAAITISATIIAFVTQRLNLRLETLREGRGPVVETGHILILGWTNRVYQTVYELSVATANKRRPVVVIVADVDTDDMNEEISSRCGDTGKLRVICRRGDVTNPEVLRRVNLPAASAVIVLDESDDSDAGVISTVLSIKVVDPAFNVPLVVEIDSEQHAQALRHATYGRLRAVRSSAIIAQVTAQASRQPGLAAVWNDLLDFDGDEIYFKHFEQLNGKTYAEAALSFEKASVIGMTQNGTLALNPDPSAIFSSSDEIIALASDDDFAYTGLRQPTRSLTPVSLDSVPSKPEKLLIVGWSTMGETVLSELAPFLPKGSVARVIANTDYVTTPPAKSYANVTVQYEPNHGGTQWLEDALNDATYDEIVVLAYRDNIVMADADALTMLTLLLVNEQFSTVPASRTRLVAEILDARHANLARAANPDDLVVSDNLAAMMLAQLSQDARLSEVFDDLFDADGAAVHVKPASLYATEGTTITFGELVALGIARKESVIGYRVAAENRVVLNPGDTSSYMPGAGDGVIVISS